MPGTKPTTPFTVPPLLKDAFSAADALLEDEVGESASLSQPISLRRPFVFYLGHLPAFARNTARRAGAKLPPHHPFDDLFERGIDPDVEDPSKCHANPGAPPEWPAWRDVRRYREQVRAELAAAELPAATLSLIREHDLMHVETLYYMRAQSCQGSSTFVEKCLDVGDRSDYQKPVNWLFVPAGDAQLGCSKSESVSDGEGNSQFRWDNEFSRTVVSVPGFYVSKLPVTVDWAWVQREKISMPASWRVCPAHEDGSLQLFVVTVDGPVPFAHASNWPVSVSLAEARAYSKFANARLLTEVEWDRAAYGNPEEDDTCTAQFGGQLVASPGVHGNFGMHARRPVAVGRFPEAKTWVGAMDMIGNGWELVDTVFEPLPAFKPMRLYPEYSSDFFDGKHYVLKGASWATDTSLVRRSFRNFYQAHYPYVFSKFRLAKSS